MTTADKGRRRRLEYSLRRIDKLSRLLRFAADRALTMVDDTVFEPREEVPLMKLEEMERAEARGAAVERARVRQMALDELARLDREYDGQAMTGALRDFVDLLEKP